MTRVIPFVCSLTFTIAVLLVIGQFGVIQARTPAYDAMRFLSDCPVDVHGELQILASGDETLRKQARLSLDRYAMKSVACRKAIIGSLMAAMDKPELDLNRDESTYNIWREGADLIARLGATEALDLLIAHLDLTHGVSTSFSMNYQPAIRGVLGIGRSAIPKLSFALRHNSNPQIRLAVVFCLSGIGGRTAAQAMRQAIPAESNNCVAAFLRLAMELHNLQTKSARKQLTPAEKNTLEYAEIGRMSALACR